MSAKQTATGNIIDRDELPQMFPTHRHEPEFWEHLGRAIATYGFLEEVLGKAIFAFTSVQQYSPDQIDEAYKAWLPKLEQALTNPLVNLAESYGKAARENRETNTEDISKLVAEIKKAAEIRNVLCHGSWRAPNRNGESLPFFVNKRKMVFETSIDVGFLQGVQTHVAELSCSVVDTVTCLGWRFPGSSGPGKPVWRDN